MKEKSMLRQVSNPEPYIGMPVCLGGSLDTNCNIDCENGSGSGNSGSGGNNAGTIGNCIDNLPIAMAYVPMQRWEQPYDLERGFNTGTIFPSLDLPFTGGLRR